MLSREVPVAEYANNLRTRVVVVIIPHDVVWTDVAMQNVGRHVNSMMSYMRSPLMTHTIKRNNEAHTLHDVNEDSLELIWGLDLV